MDSGKPHLKKGAASGATRCGIPTRRFVASSNKTVAKNFG
jgi:hypothetical protein